MPRHIAIYKRYDTNIGLQQGKDYQIVAKKLGVNTIHVTIATNTDTPVDPLIYTSEWEFLQDWQILRTWKGK
jgi:hypothetical protein